MQTTRCIWLIAGMLSQASQLPQVLRRTQNLKLAGAMWERACSRFRRRGVPGILSEVRSDLSLIYYRIMRELAVENGVPFGEIDESESRLSLPAELVTISEKLMAYAQGKRKIIGLTAQEEELLFQRYIHISDHWNAAKDLNNSDLDIVFINRPDENSIRTVHPNE